MSPRDRAAPGFRGSNEIPKGIRPVLPSALPILYRSQFERPQPAVYKRLTALP